MKKDKKITIYLIIVLIGILVIGVAITAKYILAKKDANKDILRKFQTSYTQPYLPKGFSHVKGTDLNAGLVIEDSKGNQYVWIEVPKTEEVYQDAGLNITEYTQDEYKKIEKDLHTYTSVYRNETTYVDEYPEEIVEKSTGLTSKQYTELKQTMLKSVYQNGGFYIGRYEAGTINNIKTEAITEEAMQTPIIKADAYPYGWVTCTEAQKLSTDMESGKCTSSLMFGVQWDLVLKYLETKGSTQEELNTDSTNWGNHYNTIWSVTKNNAKYYTLDLSNWRNEPYGEKNQESKVLLSTGASDAFMKQNIYDLAGNSWEYTLEYSSESDNPCAIRGGSYGHNGYTDSASYRVNCTSSMYFFSFGFRVAIY